MPESTIVLTGKLRTTGYNLDEGQIDFIVALSKRYGKKASVVMREIVQIGAPLFAKDMMVLEERRTAREVAS